jgi:hypothetical protein
MTSTSQTGAAPHGAAAPAPAAAGGETDVDVLVVGAGQAGLALGWQPAPAAALVRARRRGTRGGTRVAQPLGLAAAVHPRGLRRPARPAVPRPRRLLPRQGRGRGLPVRLRHHLRAAGPPRHPRHPAPAGRRAVRRRHLDPHRDRPTGRRGHRPVPDAAHPRGRRPPRRRRRPAPLVRLPQPGAAARRTGPGRRRRQLRPAGRPRAGRHPPGHPRHRLDAADAAPAVPRPRPVLVATRTGALAKTGDSPIARRMRRTGDLVIGTRPRDLTGPASPGGHA